LRAGAVVDGFEHLGADERTPRDDAFEGDHLADLVGAERAGRTVLLAE
jgi:hypothetical protein